jgi:hypothetical protein
LRDPALELIQDSYSQLEQIASSIVEKIFQRFPTMIPTIMDIIIQCLNKERDHAREIVEAIIDSEQNYLFTNDRDYKDNRSDIVTGENQPGQPQQVQQRSANPFVSEMRKRIDAYFDIVLRTVRDSIPKAIGYFLVKKSQDVLQFELYNQVNSNP